MSETREDVSTAVLFSGDRATGECTMDVFHNDDPIRKAEALRESCRDDFPSCMWAVAANDLARQEMSRRRMREWGMLEDE